MDGIYYNQTVTEEVLNAMVTDLGATDFNNFSGVGKFGADKLNEITKALVTEGVLTSGDMCRCEKTDSGITVNTGTIVFKNGAKKTISEAIQIEADNGMAVYALNNIVAGTCTIEVSEDFPTDTESDYIPLCKINSDGTLSDRRSVSIAKVDFPTAIATEIYTDFDGELEISDSTWNKHNYFVITNSWNNYTELRKISSILFNESYWFSGTIHVIFKKTDTGVKIISEDTAGNDYIGGKIFFI